MSAFTHLGQTSICHFVVLGMFLSFIVYKKVTGSAFRVASLLLGVACTVLKGEIMPRCARAVSLTGYYHVYDRGNSKQIIFEDDSDRYRFLSDISDRFARHKVAVLAWCLMDNHFHLMVDDPYDNLSRAMQCALTAYAKYFNGKTGRTGHLFDNRYSRVAVESDTQAVQLLDYIHLNPVKGAIDSLEAYRWSSFRAYQLGYDPLDICDAAPMLDIVGGGVSSLLRAS